LGTTVGSVGPTTEVRGVRGLRLLAAGPCLGGPAQYGAVYPAECCLRCEAEERLRVRRNRRLDGRAAFRATMRGGPWVEGQGTAYRATDGGG